MTNTSYNCPENLVLYETPKRSCGQGLHFEGCLSTSFSIGRSYNKVCGRITGYQYGPTTAFYGSSNNIDSRYINGVSLTYGSSPRRHIWSFAAALGTSYGTALALAPDTSLLILYQTSLMITTSVRLVQACGQTLFTHKGLYGMGKAVQVKVCAVISTILHGSVESFLSPLMTILKCVFAVIIIQMKVKILHLN